MSGIRVRKASQLHHMHHSKRHLWNTGRGARPYTNYGESRYKKLWEFA